MSCQLATSLGVYVLGAARQDERRRIEAHLPRCPACRAELARLAPIPGLLASVPPDAVPEIATEPSAVPHRAAVASVITAVAAAVALAVGVVLGGSGRSAPAAHPAVTLSGANPATHVRATAALTATSWGTSIRLTIRGAPLNVRCSLVVRSRAGGSETAGVWDAWRKGPITVPASAGWRRSDIASLQVRAGTRTLVTIKARSH